MTLLVFRFRNTAFHRRAITTRSRHLSTRTGNNNNTNLNHAVAAQSSTSHHRRQSTVAPQLEAIGSTTSLTDLIRQFIEKKDEHSSLYRTDRPQKPLERIRNFPEGVKGIVRDCLRYKAIQDTPVSAWIIEYPTTAAFGSGDKGRIQSDNVGNTDPRNRTIQKYLGRIPRRQYEQQLQLQNDMRAMFPLVRIPSLERTVFPVAKLRHLTRLKQNPCCHFLKVTLMDPSHCGFHSSSIGHSGSPTSGVAPFSQCLRNRSLCWYGVPATTGGVRKFVGHVLVFFFQY